MRPRPLPDAGGWAERPGLLQRMGLGVALTLGVGLAAVGVTGFLAISAAFPPDGQGWSEPGFTAAGGLSPDEVDVAEPRADSGEERYGDDPLGDNPLYRVGELGEVTCTAPELDESDPASMEEFAHSIADCLDAAWADYFEEAGLEFSSPNRVYWHAPGHSPCGPFPSEGTAAFYCGANEGLYVGVEDIVEASAGNDEPEAYTFLLSHEYGHHVQGQSGMLAELHSARARAGEDSEDELTRRNELQANCLGGVFLGASGDSLGHGRSEQQNILDDVERRSDSGGAHTHGSQENGILWTLHGMDRLNPASCNTWAADEPLVR